MSTSTLSAIKKLNIIHTNIVCWFLCSPYYAILFILFLIHGYLLKISYVLHFSCCIRLKHRILLFDAWASIIFINWQNSQSTLDGLWYLPRFNEMYQYYIWDIIIIHRKCVLNQMYDVRVRVQMLTHDFIFNNNKYKYRIDAYL